MGNFIAYIRECSQFSDNSSSRYCLYLTPNKPNNPKVVPQTGDQTYFDSDGDELYEVNLTDEETIGRFP